MMNICQSVEQIAFCIHAYMWIVASRCKHVMPNSVWFCAFAFAMLEVIIRKTDSFTSHTFCDNGNLKEFTTLTLQPLLFFGRKNKGNPEKNKGISLCGNPHIPGKEIRNARANKKKNRKIGNRKKQGNRKKARVGGSQGARNYLPPPLGRQVYGRYPNPGKQRKSLSTIAFAGSAKIWVPRWQ